MHVAVLGLGEAGSVYAAACVRRGWSVAGYDPVDVPTPEGVTRRSSIAEAVAEADVVLGLTGATAALRVAREAAPALRPGGCFADMNTGGVSLKEDIAEALAHSEAQLADVAVVGSVPKDGAQTPLVISGPGAEAAAELFTQLGAPIENIRGEAGAASVRKLLRSCLMKGLAALVVECTEAGKAAGLEEWMRELLGGQLAEGPAAVQRLYDSTYKHAARRVHEMRAASAQLADLGVLATMVDATAALHQQLTETQSLLTEDVIAAWTDLPVANIGDARDRLGMVTGLQAPWSGARLIGRARTVLTAGGDNLGIHRLLPHTRPGDVIVVDGQGEPARALVGELLAGRLIAKGVRGMVIDGAIRDAEDLEAMNFPIWSRARSAAGPYKNGPFRHGQPVSIGGAVCQEGDLVVADGDGVAFIRPSEAAALLVAARSVQEDEAERRRAIDAQIAATAGGTREKAS